MIVGGVKESDEYQELMDGFQDIMDEIIGDIDHQLSGSFGGQWYVPPLIVGGIGVGWWLSREYPGWPFEPIDDWNGGRRLPGPSLEVGNGFRFRPIGYYDDDRRVYPGAEIGYEHSLPDIGPADAPWHGDVSIGIDVDPGGFNGASGRFEWNRPIAGGGKIGIGGSGQINRDSEWNAMFQVKFTW